MTNLMTMMQGIPAFFQPNVRSFAGVNVPLGPEAAGYYSTEPLADTLSQLIDFNLINGGGTRLTVGAANVGTAEMRYFDSRDTALDVRHVLASGALPPAFPAVRIDGELYWDGGILSNTPVEAMDQDFSFFRVISYGLRADSCGKGAHRGGAGFSRSYEILKDGALVAHYSDRFTGSASGIFGGGSGASGKSEVLRAGQVIQLDSKSSFPLLRGDIVTISLGGGGGYGAPADRPAALIQRDLEDGIITKELAESWAK
jgi:predicted acylesterase/phospholipase RssA